MPPADLISAASVRVKSALLATSATRYPCANRRATAAPSPAPTPTTTATGELADTSMQRTLPGCVRSHYGGASVLRGGRAPCNAPGHGRRRRLGDHRPALLRSLRLPARLLGVAPAPCARRLVRAPGDAALLGDHPVRGLRRHPARPPAVRHRPAARGLSRGTSAHRPPPPPPSAQHGPPPARPIPPSPEPAIHAEGARVQAGGGRRDRRRDARARGRSRPGGLRRGARSHNPARGDRRDG